MFDLLSYLCDSTGWFCLFQPFLTDSIPTWFPILWKPGFVFTRCSSGQSMKLTSLFSAEVKDACSYACTVLYAAVALCLIRHGGNFTCFYFVPLVCM
jgi:hypothetical protein